ncbi:hypothetical protein [Rufibacter ruber]|uniref:hypothetical protein n=1 Tax=Rufibacter ruber TaxID=1783499 RepID=UPI00082A6387|nr:hypothetical protein [Rufibacter ruber]
MPRAGYVPRAKRVAELEKAGKLPVCKLPKALTPEVIAAALPKTLKLETAMHLVSFIAKEHRVRRSRLYNNDRDAANFEQLGFVSIHSDKIKSQVVSRYPAYIAALKEAGIIEVFDFKETEVGRSVEAHKKIKEAEFLEHLASLTEDERRQFDAPAKKARGTAGSGSYQPDKFSKPYKICDRWNAMNYEEYQQYRTVFYTNEETILKVLEPKTEKEIKLIKKSREKLVDMAEAIVQACDTDRTHRIVEGWLNTHLGLMKTNKKLDYFTLQGQAPQVAVMYLEDLKEEFWFNDYEAKGGRKYTPLSNMDRNLRPFFRINGALPWTIDIKNSQFFMLSQVARHPAQAKKMLLDTPEEFYEDFCNAIDQLAALYATDRDTKNFLDAAAEGRVYEYVAASLGITRDKAKKLLLGVVFSGQLNYLKTKEKLSAVAGELITLVGKLNDPDNAMAPAFDEDQFRIKGSKLQLNRLKKGKPNTLAKLLQHFESVMFIDKAAVIAVIKSVNKYDFETIHDSFHCHPDDVEALQVMLEQVFVLGGFDKPTVESHQLSEEYPAKAFAEKFKKKKQRN